MPYRIIIDTSIAAGQVLQDKIKQFQSESISGASGGATGLPSVSCAILLDESGEGYIGGVQLSIVNNSASGSDSGSSVTSLVVHGNIPTYAGKTKAAVNSTIES